jgi:hypothetical protein
MGRTKFQEDGDERILEPKKKGSDRENCTIRSFVIGTLHQILLG